MAIPLTTLNPWEIDQENSMPKRIIFKDILYVFQKNKSIFQFKFLNNIHNQNI
jgi:hypothetical protein